MTFWFGFESGVMFTVFVEIAFLAALLVAGVRARRTPLSGSAPLGRAPASKGADQP